MFACAGVLDIFGFEIFENNSFEQLCINYCNEKLQQHFNFHVFKAEEKCYKSEEIDYTEVRFVDNQDVLDLIELKPYGLMPVLDDECKRPGGAESSFVEKICKHYADNARFKTRPKMVVRTIDGGVVPAEQLFGVHHYAGMVVYNCQNFMDKNKDELLLSVRETLQSSTFPFITLLFRAELATAGGAKDKLSQSFQFRDQLSKLMDTLNKTEPHYIRCVKPNNSKLPGVFDAQICLQQLRYAGVFEAVKIRQLGYPFRWTYDLFYKRYRCCAADPVFRQRIPSTLDWKDAVRRLIADLIIPAPMLDGVLKFGKTMVLYRADPNRILEMMRDHARDVAADFLQRVYRGHRARKLARELRRVRTLIRNAIKARELAQATAALQEALKLKFPLFDTRELTVLQKRLVVSACCNVPIASVAIRESFAGRESLQGRSHDLATIRSRGQV
jgi:myosin-5